MSNKRNDISILYMAVSVISVSILAISIALAMKTQDVSDKCDERAEEANAIYEEYVASEESDPLEVTSMTFLAVPEQKPAPETPLSKSEIDLIALVTMGEAEGESEEGKRLVIDTILNRVDNEQWPDTVTEVIYQPNQFEVMWNGRLDRCYVIEDIRQLVIEESINRTNSEVVYFRTKRYSSFGTPLFQVGNHYFSGV